MTDVTKQSLDIELTWKKLLAEEKQKPYFQAILEKINELKSSGVKVYPEKEDIFNALKYTPFMSTRVVILGQDPYHGPNQAHGLAFSVQPGIALPPSLRNIFIEMHNDLNIAPHSSGCLINWAKQGVLLLNNSLSVTAGQPQSHAQFGWQQFTDQIIVHLNQHPKKIVFLLWGKHAQSKIPLIDQDKHAILKAPHPSPLSSHRGFFGCKHFSTCNELLKQAHRQPIQWDLTTVD